MNKIIWKDIDSTTIKGLIISELPPITKPRMRVQETEIDGVDGSIIEELGYESYDKSMKIGLSYNYDIDEVIKYFSGEGNVIFSNEPDKYYKARILDQIDYERLLRFKEATVTFRVQPFKYGYMEEQAILQEQEVTGTSVKVENQKITKVIVEGSSTQNGTPTPSAPVEIKSLSGNVEIKNVGNNASENSQALFTLIEPLRSLPNGVKDIAYIKNNRLYIDRYVGSVVLDGSEEWLPYIDTPVDGYVYYISSITNCKIGFEKSICSHFANYNSAWEVGEIGQYSDHFILKNKYFVSDIATIDEFKTWLANNNVELIYELEEPIKEEVTDEVGSLQLYVNENNINSNVDIVVNYVDTKLIVNNLGNHKAKPVMKITGTGTIELIVNGNKLFSYTFPDGEDKVVIDSQKQDAYLGSVLKNRNMSGEFPVFEIGENIITWDGVISNIEISSKSRWL